MLLTQRGCQRRYLGDATVKQTAQLISPACIAVSLWGQVDLEFPAVT